MRQQDLANSQTAAQPPLVVLLLLFVAVGLLAARRWWYSSECRANAKETLEHRKGRRRFYIEYVLRVLSVVCSMAHGVHVRGVGWTRRLCAPERKSNGHVLVICGFAG